MAVNIAVALEYRATDVLCGDSGPQRTFLPKGFVQFARTCTCDSETATPGKSRSPSAPGAVRRVGRVWALRTVFSASACRERTPGPVCGQVWRVRAPRLVFSGSGACVWPSLACLSSQNGVSVFRGLYLAKFGVSGLPERCFRAPEPVFGQTRRVWADLPCSENPTCFR
jgi:hypothetical protein